MSTMMTIRKNTRDAIKRTFDLITFRLGGNLLLLSNIVFPHGLHRRWIRMKGCWLWPFCMMSVVLSTLVLWRQIFEHPILAPLLLLPIFVLTLHDFIAIWMAPLPPAKEKE
jgi:hypothetical protein